MSVCRAGSRNLGVASSPRVKTHSCARFLGRRVPPARSERSLVTVVEEQAADCELRGPLRASRSCSRVTSKEREKGSLCVWGWEGAGSPAHMQSPQGSEERSGSCGGREVVAQGSPRAPSSVIVGWEKKERLRAWDDAAWERE